MTTAETQMHVADALFSHVWMVRTFIKHSEEAAEDDELSEVHRDLYDVMLALGASVKANDPEAYFKQLRKKLAKLQNARQTFAKLQPEISTHTNFHMAARSLNTAVDAIVALVGQLEI